MAEAFQKRGLKTTVLELRMIEQGFEVLIARNTEHARKHLQRGDIQLVVTEVDLKPQDGFALLQEAKKQGWAQEAPWVFVTARTGRNDAQTAFGLGASDFISKPVGADLLVAKLKQTMEREARGTTRGVSGSLQEMGLPEIIQVLWHGRKTGSLKIRAGKEAGEIHFVDGEIHNAMWGNLRGEQSFYAMLKLDKGDFMLDPNKVATSRVINASPEALLLEGMRLLDGGSA